MTCSPWLTRADVCDPNTDVSPRLADSAIQSASAWLYDSTCGAFPGRCSSRLRPSGPVPARCRTDAELHRIDLTTWIGGPIRSIEAVTVDGVEVDADGYRLVNARWLVAHRDGPLWPWPTQDEFADDGDPGTWSVDVVHGEDPPPHLLDAAADLAKQLIAKCLGGECDLPDNATSISKDGMSIQLAVPTKGETGLPLVDSIVAMYPCRQRRRLLDPAARRHEVSRLG